MPWYDDALIASIVSDFIFVLEIKPDRDNEAQDLIFAVHLLPRILPLPNTPPDSLRELLRERLIPGTNLQD